MNSTSGKPNYGRVEIRRFPNPGAREEWTTEVARLKRELARVTEGRDILKKPW